MTTFNLVRQAQHMSKEAPVPQHAAPRSRHASALLHPDSKLPCPSTALVSSSQGAEWQLNATYAQQLRFKLGQRATRIAGRRQQAVTCCAQNTPATAVAVAEVPKDMHTPQEVASVFQRLQNGSDIRGIAIAGL